MMMKKLILSMVLALATGVALAQTDFRHISYQEGLEAAKAEGKLLFVGCKVKTGPAQTGCKATPRQGAAQA